MLCKICGAEFEFSLGEQVFYKDRGFDPPKRCPQCRAKKRREEKGKNESILYSDKGEREGGTIGGLG